MVNEMFGLDVKARQQFGLISRDQAMEAGASLDWIKWRLKRGEWELFRRGVYRFRASTLTWSQHAMGALLLGGPESALSHQTAAFLHGLDGFTKERPKVLELTVPASRRFVAPAVRLHRTVEAAVPTEVVRSLRVTSLARTLFDLSTVLTPGRLEVALDSARRGRSLLPDELKEYLATLKARRHGVPLLGELLAARQSPVDSALEVEFLQEVARRGLPAPVAGYSVFIEKRFIMKVDCAWVQQKVAAHLDSYRYHHHRERFERDARQRSLLAGAKWHSVAITHRALRGHEWSDTLKRLLLP